MGISFFMTIFGSCGLIYLEYHHDRLEIENSISDIHKSTEALIADSLWIVNDDILGTVISGLLHIRHIEAVEIRKPDNSVIRKGHSNAEKSFVHEHDMYKSYRGKEVKLGHIKITVNLDSISDQIFIRSLRIIGTQAIFSILLACCVLGMFYLKVGRHLFAMSTYSKGMTADALSVPLVLDRPRSSNKVMDEIGQLSSAINKMRKKLKSSLQGLKEREEKYRTILQTAMDGVVITDTNGCFLEANPAYSQMTGYSTDELKKMNLADIEAKESPEQVAAHIRRIKEKQGDRFESVQQRKDNTLFHVHVSARYLDLENGVFVVFLKDITEQLEAEKRIRQVHKMESIGNLAGGIAHDFNNILFPIVGMAELLMDDLAQGSLEYENAAEILKAGIRGGDLVKQILSFSRQTEHKLIPVRIQHILKEVLNLCRATIPADIEIEQDIQADCGLILADSTQIHQVAMNILTNAFHAIEPGSGRIAVRLRSVMLAGDELTGSTLGPGRYSLLTISDTGKGIPAGLAAKIFEPYFTTKEQGKGTGLGLSVAYGIIKEHRGDIKVYSEAGTGTTVNIYLPLMKDSSVPESQTAETICETGRERILLVDDEPSIVTLEKQMLERLGYSVTSRVNSLEALAAFTQNPFRFDLVITDMTMPSMTGDQLTKALRKIRPDIPVIVCTGFSERLDREKAESTGINGFLMKPVIKSEMAKMIRCVLTGSKT
jgi:PAS domain S-box-containing protein